MSGDSSKLHEMNPRKHRAASHKAGGRARAACAAPAPLAPPRPSPRPQHPNEIPRNGKIRASCMIRGVCAAKRSPSWQDLRAVYSRKAICRAFRIHGARILPKSAHFGCMAAICCQEGALSRPRHLLGYMKRKTCHGLPPGNAPGRNIAIARHQRTHRGVTEPGDATRTKHRPIQHHALTRPRNHENILVPSAKKRR